VVRGREQSPEDQCIGPRVGLARGGTVARKPIGIASLLLRRLAHPSKPRLERTPSRSTSDGRAKHSSTTNPIVPERGLEGILVEVFREGACSRAMRSHLLVPPSIAAVTGAPPPFERTRRREVIWKLFLLKDGRAETALLERDRRSDLV
jgi:hypothetical protein